MTDKHNHTPQSSVSLPPMNEEFLATLDPEMLDFVRRTSDAYTKIYDPTVEQNLRNLHEAGDERAFESELEDIVYDILEDEPEYQQLRADLRQARDRRNKTEEAKITARINELDAHYRKLVLSVTGFLDSDKAYQLEQASNQIASILDQNPGIDKSNPDDVMKALNILVTDNQTGKITYRFPTELMPESVNKLWDTYLVSVGDYNRANATLTKSGDKADRDALVEIDQRRKRIHDQLTKDFQAVIGLSDAEGWDFDTTRNRLATIRDREFSHYGAVARNDYEAELVRRQNAKMDHVIASNEDAVAVLAKLSAKKKTR